MDIDRDNVKQHHLVPNNVYSASVASDDVSMQVDTPFDGHHVADSSYRGKSILQSHLLYYMNASIQAPVRYMLATLKTAKQITLALRVLK
jgi:hypothetical protein